MTTNMYIATFAWLMLVYSYTQRRRTIRHMCCSLAGMLCDVSLVTYLQLTRNAVETAVSFKLGFFQQCHIGVSTLALVLYLPIVILGFKLYFSAGDYRLRMLHKRIAITALILRTMGFVLMFSMLDKY